MDSNRNRKVRPNLEKLNILLTELGHPEHFSVVQEMLDGQGELILGQRQDLFQQLFQWQKQSALSSGRILQMIGEVFGLNAGTIKRYRTEMGGPVLRSYSRSEPKTTINLKRLEAVLIPLGHPEHLSVVRNQLNPDGTMTLSLRKALIRQLIQWSNESFTKISYETIGLIFDLSRGRIEQICRRGKERIRSNRKVEPFEARLAYLQTPGGRAYVTLRLAAIARTEGNQFWQGGGFSALNQRAVVTALGFPSDLGLNRLQRVWQTLRQTQVIINDLRADVVLRYGLGAEDPTAYLGQLCQTEGVKNIQQLLEALTERTTAAGCISIGRYALINFLAESFIRNHTNKREGGK